MDVMCTRGAGWDGQQQTVMAWRVPPAPSGQQADGIMALQACGTMPCDLLAWSDWVAEVGVTPVALASTGADGRPLDNLLEGTLAVWLVNAAHVTQVPGRKTDQADARGLATRMRDGRLAASGMPPPGQRAGRARTRDRTTLVQERRRDVTRVPGVWARAHLTVAAVATAIMGGSGRAILAALVTGRAAPATMAEVAPGRRRTKLPLWEQALPGLIRDHHRRLLPRPLVPSDCVEEPIDAVSVERMRSLTARDPRGAVTPPSGRAEAVGEATETGAPRAADSPRSLAQAVTVLDTMPGVDQRGAERLVAEGGDRHAPLWHRSSPVGLDGRGAGPCCKRRHTALGHNPPGPSHPADRPDAPGPGGGADARDGALGLVSAPGDPSGANTGDHGRRLGYRGQCLA